SLYRDGIAIAKGKENELNNQVIIAQAADTLLTMDNIIASFVISKRSEGIIGISARSLGSVNVQIIMESLQGGGHLTNAATQLTGLTLEETETQLKLAIDEYLEGVKKE
ncbi:MAG: DHHA1 domain-containing protein, partial [Neobacillus sp.]